VLSVLYWFLPLKEKDYSLIYVCFLV
jgi:hypothetical protein